MTLLATKTFGDWVVATLILDSPKASSAEGFMDSYADVLGRARAAKKLLAILGRHDSDALIGSLLSCARSSGADVYVHFIADSVMADILRRQRPDLTVVEDLRQFLELNGLSHLQLWQ